MTQVEIKQSGELVIPESNKLNFIEWGKFDKKVMCISGKSFYKKFDLKVIKRMLQGGDFDNNVIVLLHNGHIGFGMSNPTEREKEQRFKRLLNLIEGTEYKITKQLDNSFIISNILGGQSING
jgi:hypothetical protein